MAGLEGVTCFDTLFIDENPVTHELLRFVQQQDRLGAVFWADFATFDYSMLRQIPDVPWLHLVRNRMTDDDLKYLTGRKRLVHLSLRSMAVSETGLKHLETLKTVREIDLELTSLTPRSIQEFSRRMNGVVILDGTRERPTFTLDGQRYTERPAPVATEPLNRNR